MAFPFGPKILIKPKLAQKKTKRSNVRGTITSGLRQAIVNGLFIGPASSHVRRLPLANKKRVSPKKKALFNRKSINGRH